MNPKKEVLESIEKASGTKGTLVNGSSCNCPSDCDGTIYFMEMSQAKMRGENSAFFDKEWIEFAAWIL